MSSFTQGLDILLRQLQSLDTDNRPRFDQSLIDRIRRMKIEPSAGPVEANSAASEMISHTSAAADHLANPTAADAQKLVPADRQQRITSLRDKVLVCTKCSHLAASRHTVVFGVGNPSADLMFVGEAPGADEDLRGEPFVGRAGELLTRIIETMGFERSDVYIANVLKCRTCQRAVPEIGSRHPKKCKLACPISEPRSRSLSRRLWLLLEASP